MSYPTPERDRDATTESRTGSGRRGLLLTVAGVLALIAIVVALHLAGVVGG